MLSGSVFCGATSRASFVKLGPQAVIVRGQRLVCGFELEDPGDAGNVDSGGDEFGDSLNGVEVVVAVATRSTGCPCRRKKASTLIQSQRLRIESREFGGHRYPVQAAL